jgi:hypothetical protein
MKQNKNIFGLIKITKEVNVTETRILQQIKNLDKVKIVFELVIHTPKLNYTTEVGSTIKIKVKLFFSFHLDNHLIII